MDSYKLFIRTMQEICPLLQNFSEKSVAIKIIIAKKYVILKKKTCRNDCSYLKYLDKLF